MRLVAYTRHSTLEQSASPQTQETAIREYCGTHGHDLLRVYHEEAISGKSEVERRRVFPLLLEEIRDRKRDFDGIVIYHTDRLCRNPVEWHKVIAELRKQKCELVSVSNPVSFASADDRLVSGIFAQLAAYERERVGERVYSHNLSRLLKGQWPGGRPPLGLDYDKTTQTLSLNERSADVEAVFAEFVRQGGNFLATARRLNRHGLLGRDNTPWRDGSVRAIVTNPIYRRRLHYDGREVEAPALIPKLIPDNLLATADDLLQRIKPLRTSARTRKYAYSGLLYCSECGGRMKHSGGAAFPGWVCRLQKESSLCEARQVSERYIDSLVGQALSKMFVEVSSEITSQVKPLRKDTRKRQARQGLIARKERLNEMYELGAIDRIKYLRRLEELEADIIAAEEPRERPVLMSKESIEGWLELLEGKWPSISHDERRELLTIIGAQIVVCTQHHTRLWVEITSHLLPYPVRATAKRVSNRGVKKRGCPCRLDLK